MKKYDFCKAMGKWKLNVLRTDFNIDIENLDVSENFKGQKYIKSEMEDDIFLFFKNKILFGMLIGNSRNKEYSDFEYYAEEFASYNPNRLSRNRKNYTEIADEIIRIKKSDMNLKRKQKINIKTKSLKERLAEYKRNKYNNVSNEQIQKMSQEIIIAISKQLFNKLPDEYKRIVWYGTQTYAELLEAFSKIVQDYQISYKRLIEKDYIYKETMEKNVNDGKINIIKFYTKLKNIL